MDADGTEYSMVDMYCVVYSLSGGEWVAKGKGWSQLHLYHDISDNTFRIVGWTVSDYCVVINVNVTQDCSYKKKSEDFHKMMTGGGKETFGFGFYRKQESLDEAQRFLESVLKAIESDKQKHIASKLRHEALEKEQAIYEKHEKEARERRRRIEQEEKEREEKRRIEQKEREERLALEREKYSQNKQQKHASFDFFSTGLSRVLEDNKRKFEQQAATASFSSSSSPPPQPRARKAAAAVSEKSSHGKEQTTGKSSSAKSLYHEGKDNTMEQLWDPKLRSFKMGQLKILPARRVSRSPSTASSAEMKKQTAATPQHDSGGGGGGSSFFSRSRNGSFTTNNRSGSFSKKKIGGLWKSKKKGKAPPPPPVRRKTVGEGGFGRRQKKSVASSMGEVGRSQSTIEVMRRLSIDDDAHTVTKVDHQVHVKFDPETRKYSGLPKGWGWERQLHRQFGLGPLAVERMEVPGYTSRIPLVLLQMKRYLFENGGLQTEGIFRLAPDHNECARVKKELDAACFERCEDINVIANLIKVWFREMPTKLLTGIDPKRIQDCKNQEDALNIVSTLKEPSQSILLWLLDALAIVSQYQYINKMSPQNLAIVMAPNLFSADHLSPMEGLLFSQKVAFMLYKAVVGRTEVLRKKHSHKKTSSIAVD